MIDLSFTEFYNTPSGDVIYQILNDGPKVLSADCREVVESMFELICATYKDAAHELIQLYSKSSQNLPFYHFKIVHRFCRCNFGEYDSQRYDVDGSGFLNVEQVKCPLRNTADCPYCNIICNPKIERKLTDRELQILEMLSDGMTNQDIADMLGLSVFTIIKHRNTMRAKLGLRNTPALINYFKNLKR